LELVPWWLPEQLQILHKKEWPGNYYKKTLFPLQPSPFTGKPILVSGMYLDPTLCFLCLCGEPKVFLDLLFVYKQDLISGRIRC